MERSEHKLLAEFTPNQNTDKGCFLKGTNAIWH